MQCTYSWVDQPRIGLLEACLGLAAPLKRKQLLSWLWHFGRAVNCSPLITFSTKNHPPKLIVCHLALLGLAWTCFMGCLRQLESSIRDLCWPVAQVALLSECSLNSQCLQWSFFPLKLQRDRISATKEISFAFSFEGQEKPNVHQWISSRRSLADETACL